MYRMEKKTDMDLADVRAEIIALRTVVLLLVGRAWGQKSGQLREIREGTVKGLTRSLEGLDLGKDGAAFTADVIQRLELLLADAPTRQ